PETLGVRARSLAKSTSPGSSIPASIGIRYTAEVGRPGTRSGRLPAQPPGVYVDLRFRARGVRTAGGFGLAFFADSLVGEADGDRIIEVEAFAVPGRGDGGGGDLGVVEVRELPFGCKEGRAVVDAGAV